LVNDIPAGDRKMASLFYSVEHKKPIFGQSKGGNYKQKTKSINDMRYKYNKLIRESSKAQKKGL
jgi:hypothetical protein